MTRLPTWIGLAVLLAACPRGPKDVPSDRDTLDIGDADTDADSDADSDADTDADSDTDTDTDPTGIDTGEVGFQIVINEILADPNGQDANCDGAADLSTDEFIEVVNSGSTTIDLSGATLSDITSVKFTFPANTILDPAGAVVVFGGGTPTFDGSAAALGAWCLDLPDTVQVLISTLGLDLNNDGDTVTLTGPQGVTLDTEDYAVEAAEGQSVNRSPELQVNDMVRHRDVPGAINAFSPGTLANLADFSTIPPIETGDTGGGGGPEDYSGLVLNEIMADPTNVDTNCDGVLDSVDDEFVEIVNTLAVAVDLTDVEIVVGGTSEHIFPAGTTVDAGGTIVVFGGGTAVFPGVGVEPWCLALPAGVVLQVGGTLSLNNGGDDVSLVDPAGVTITSYTYGSEGDDDQSLVRDPEYSANAMVQHTTVSSFVASPGTRADLSPHDPFAVETGDTGGGGITGDTGADVNDTGDPGFAVVFNEMLADPAGADANCDLVQVNNDEEFVEIVNIGTVALELGGGTVSDFVGLKHVFAPGTVVPPAGTIVVFAGGAPDFGGGSTDPWCGALPPEVQVVVSSTGALGLNDAGDTVTLTGPAGTILASDVFSGQVDESANRDPELDPAAPFVDHTSIAGAINAFSPGTRVDGGALSEPVVGGESGDTGAPGDTGGDTGSPIVINDTGDPGFGFVLNEILADPGALAGDANCDLVISSGDDEFVEIVNTGTVPIELGGGTITDSLAVQHVFEPGTVVSAGGAIVVFAGGAPAFGGGSVDPWCSALPANVSVQLASAGHLFLTNDGDTVTVAGPGGFILAAYTWGTEGNSDESLNRDPDLDPTVPMVQHTTLNAALTWSPGTRVDGTPF